MSALSKFDPGAIALNRLMMGWVNMSCQTDLKGSLSPALGHISSSKVLLLLSWRFLKGQSGPKSARIDETYRFRDDKI